MTAARGSQPVGAASEPTRLAGWLPDGTPRYAPVGRLLVDGDRVCCHLCGQWFLSVASHLRAHGWSKAEYVDAFGLELGNPLTGAATRQRRAAALTARHRTEPAIAQAQQQARARARSGELAALAAAANTGRQHSPERRAKTLAALRSVDPQARARASARRARARLVAHSTQTAAAFGFEQFSAYAANRIAAGLSLAAISREAGRHKDWLSRHLATIGPTVQAADRPDPNDRRWQPILTDLGFTDLSCYLHTRHVEQHRTVAAIATESGRSRDAVTSALRRHGIHPVPHAGTRHAAADRDAAIARRLGSRSLAEYLSARRSVGLTWSALAAETGLPETTLRRRC